MRTKEIECGECEKKFRASKHVMIRYSTEKIEAKDE